MKIFQKDFTNLQIAYPLDKIAEKERMLFLDIETTGFTAKTAKLYMIGCAYYRNDCFHLIQWFSENNEDEKNVLVSFLEFSKNYSFLVHFNGNNFDLPFLVEKFKQYEMMFHIECYDGLDLYRRILPFKNFLKLTNCKQKTIEAFLGINREDPYPGGELIEVYRNYLKEPSDTAYKILSLHNAEDVEGMLRILPILSYVDLFFDPIKVTKASGNYYHDLNGAPAQEIVLNLSFPIALPVHINTNANGCYFVAEGTSGSLRIPLYEEEMKYFYANYKDYYYLPEEDLALHKSVSGFVDHKHRVAATAATCYTRKRSLFLREWDILFTPIFKKDYSSKEIYFELTDEMKTDRAFFSQYASHVLTSMLKKNVLK